MPNLTLIDVLELFRCDIINIDSDCSIDKYERIKRQREFIHIAQSQIQTWIEECVGETIREILIQMYYEEMHPIAENTTVEELNNRKEKAIDEYLGRNQRNTFIPILHAKVDKARYFFIQEIRQKVRTNG